MNNLKRLSTSEELPADLALAKRHARVWSDDDDNYLKHLIMAAAATMEGGTGIGLALLTSDWLQHHSTREVGAIMLPLTPVQSVTKVEIMLSGAWSVVDAATYRVTTGIRPAMVEPVTCWPAHDAIRITLKAGFGDEATDIPADLQAALYMLVTHWFENRAPLDGQGAPEMPYAVTSILNRYS